MKRNFNQVETVTTEASTLQANVQATEVKFFTKLLHQYPAIVVDTILLLRGRYHPPSYTAWVNIGIDIADTQEEIKECENQITRLNDLFYSQCAQDMIVSEEIDFEEDKKVELVKKFNSLHFAQHTQLQNIISETRNYLKSLIEFMKLLDFTSRLNNININDIPSTHTMIGSGFNNNNGVEVMEQYSSVRLNESFIFSTIVNYIYEELPEFAKQKLNKILKIEAHPYDMSLVIKHIPIKHIKNICTYKCTCRHS